MKSKRLFFFGILAACSSTPTNFAGSYAATVTSGANNCQFQNWTDGSSTNITAQITQDGPDAQLTVPTSTLPGAFLVYVLGTNTFAGKVNGDEFTATYLGTKQTTVQGTACSYSVNTKLDVTLTNQNGADVLAGTLSFTPVTNGDPSCGALNQCTNTDTVTGSRTAQ